MGYALQGRAPQVEACTPPARTIYPITCAVHALKALLLKNIVFQGINSDILILSGFSVAPVGLSVAFFKRQI